MLQPFDVQHVVDEGLTHPVIERLKKYFDVTSLVKFFNLFNEIISRLLVTWTKHIDKNDSLGLRQPEQR